MPGPGLDLVGDEELAEPADVIRSGRLSRHRPDDASFPAKVHAFESYSQREHLLARRTPSGRSCPFDCECHQSTSRYEVGMLPATDALLARSVSSATGVLDPSLAPNGLRMRDTADVAGRRAQRFIDVYREVVT